MQARVQYGPQVRQMAMGVSPDVGDVLIAACGEEGISVFSALSLELLFYAVKRQCACWKKIRVTFGFKALTIAQLTYQLMYDHSTNVTCAF